MWPFKKKRTLLTSEKAPFTFETVICIPGEWSSWDEFILSIVESTNGEYLAAGQTLMNIKNKTHCQVEFCEKDERMEESFRYAGRATGVTENFLTQIGKHKHVVYLSGTTGNMAGAASIAFAAEAVLKAGGLGVKVETAGKAFERDLWVSLLMDYGEPKLFEMFVIDCIVDDKGSVHSCGMQNLGYKDTIVSGEEFQNAVGLIRIFSYFQIVDKPVIKDGETFTPAPNSPRFRIIHEIDQPYKGEELFENPFGMWKLVKG